MLQGRDPEEVLMILRKTRRAYLVEYLCAFVALGGLGLALLKGVALPSMFTYGVLGFTGVALGAAEFQRALTRYRITGEKLTIIRGIVRQAKENVYWQPLGFVADIHTQQTRLQRLLNYGTIIIPTGQDGGSKVKDISNPDKVMQLLERLVEKGREAHKAAASSS